MIELLKTLLSSGLIFGICYIATVIGKCVIAKIISNNNDMSDEKVKSLTEMMSHDININFPQ